MAKRAKKTEKKEETEKKETDYTAQAYPFDSPDFSCPEIGSVPIVVEMKEEDFTTAQGRVYNFRGIDDKNIPWTKREKELGYPLLRKEVFDSVLFDILEKDIDSRFPKDMISEQHIHLLKEINYHLQALFNVFTELDKNYPLE